MVLARTADTTSGGLSASDLHHTGTKIVSKARHHHGKRLAKKPGSWISCVAKARKALGLTGFVLLNVGPEGKALYALAKKYQEA
jgi:DVNP family